MGGALGGGEPDVLPLEQSVEQAAPRSWFCEALPRGYSYPFFRTAISTPRGSAAAFDVRRRRRRNGRLVALPVHILRLAGIYGPGRNLLVKLREGDARRIVKRGQVFNRAHLEDTRKRPH